MTIPRSDAVRHRLRTAAVVRVDEDACHVWDNGRLNSVGYAPPFPSPRTERVSPGHLVAIATDRHGAGAVVWRWYDAVVIGVEGGGVVRLWEPAHGEVVARARESYRPQAPGSRAYASAGLPGADWWVVDTASSAADAVVELDEVDALYERNGLWPIVFATYS